MGHHPGAERLDRLLRSLDWAELVFIEIAIDILRGRATIIHGLSLMLSRQRRYSARMMLLYSISMLMVLSAYRPDSGLEIIGAWGMTLATALSLDNLVPHLRIDGGGGEKAPR